MKKSIFVLIIVVLALSFSKAQTSADSLLGKYAGLCYYKSPTSNPWTITEDTIFVTSIDTINCTVTISSGQYGCLTGSNFSFYRNFHSCSPLTNCGEFPNCCDKFYGSDSLSVLCNNVTPQPPSQSYSSRFYGRRISNAISGIKDLSNNKKFQIYPNPAKENLTIETFQKALIEISNIEGQIIKTINAAESKTIIDLQSFSSGVYLVKARMDEGVIVKKFIKQ